MDLYVVTSSTGQKVKLYIDMYHPQNEPAKQLAPKGFYKATGSASAARADGKDSKNYLNLSLPRGSRFTPIVLTASERKAIVARVAEVDGKREIQVLEGHGDKWDFVGKQGRAVTGVDGNFLIDAKQGPDGRLWVLAGYTPPSNPDRGFSNYLYCFENDRWKLAGPQKGQPSDFFGTDFGVHFLGGAEPVRHFVAGKEIPDPRQNHNLMRLDENRFVPLPAQDLVRKHHGTMVWRKNDAWYFVPRNADGRADSTRRLEGAADFQAIRHFGPGNDRGTGLGRQTRQSRHRQNVRPTLSPQRRPALRAVRTTTAPREIHGTFSLVANR